MEGISSPTNQSTRIVLSVGIVHRNWLLGSAWAGRSTAEGRSLGTPPLAHLSRNPRQHGARKPQHEAPETPQWRLGDPGLAQWSGTLREAVAMRLSRKLIVPLARQLLRRVAVHVSVLVSLNRQRIP